jgi:hypothetical protein
VAESATAAQLASRRGPAEAGHPPAVAAELAALVCLHPAVAAVSDHGALFGAPDDSAPGRGEALEAPMGLLFRASLGENLNRFPAPDFGSVGATRGARAPGADGG